MEINWKKLRHAIKAARKGSMRERRMLERCIQCGGKQNRNYEMIRREYLFAYRSTLKAFMA